MEYGPSNLSKWGPFAVDLLQRKKRGTYSVYCIVASYVYPYKTMVQQKNVMYLDYQALASCLGNQCVHH